MRRGAKTLAGWSLAQRRAMAIACCRTVVAAARDWVNEACRHKRIPNDSGARGEEIAGGPIAVVRQLQLLIATFDDLIKFGRPRLSGKIQQVDGQLRIPVFPTRQLFDPWLFGSMRAETWLEPGVQVDSLFDPAVRGLIEPDTASPEIVCVLGAGNVSSIAATDALSKIFGENKAVLLKMNPVNQYMGGIFEFALAPLIKAEVLRIVLGGAEVGHRAVNHVDINDVHITGSAATHDAIVWGGTAEERAQNLAGDTPQLRKRITSELGNVTPWAVVPGDYTQSQLLFQAENIAASIANNASFNCIATKIIITSRRWRQREAFLAAIESALARTPLRYAYYPGAAERFERFAERATEDRAYLPWTLRRDIDADDQRHLLDEESFVAVCGEVCLDEDSPHAFLAEAVSLMNGRIWGTLAASLTLPTNMRKSAALEKAVSDLHYGTIGINQWSAVAFALMSPPWGAYAGSSIRDIQSGIGFVHNTFLLNRPQKTILRSPLTMWPKPLWFSSHRRPESLAWKLLRLYESPRIVRLPPLMLNAALG